jgi:hypothetical protein
LLFVAIGVILLTTTALNGSLARYRYPLDPLIAVLAAGGLIGGLQLLAAWLAARSQPAPVVLRR